MTLRAILVDDHKILQQGVKRLLESRPGIEVVGCAQNAEDGLRLVGELKPDLGIFDLGLPDHSGFWLIREVRKVTTSMPILVLSMHTEYDLIGSVLKAGANGDVDKSADADELAEAVRQVTSGGRYLPDGVAEHIETRDTVPDAPRRTLTNDYSSTVLDSKEVDVLRLAAKGMSNQDMAGELNISVSTVKSRLRSTFDKLNVDSRTAAVAAALSLGILGNNKSS